MAVGTTLDGTYLCLPAYCVCVEIAVKGEIEVYDDAYSFTPSQNQQLDGPHLHCILYPIERSLVLYTVTYTYFR